MKLLRLEIENLNALYGAHTVDFEGDLQGAPLFLISGPTGAGKSTLLDAISLALFGVTPRLRNERGKQDTGPAHVLSRGTAAGKAVLTFRKSSPSGPVTYRARWEVWRGNRKSPKVTGNLVGPYRWLEELGPEGWKPVATDYQGRASDLGMALKEALEGFSYEDFTRCMLLAQGDFAAFLKAEESERAEILERLTRTERYRQLGAMAAERWREAGRVVSALEAELGGIQLLGEAELESLRQELSNREKLADEARKQLDGLQAQLAWIQGRDQLDQELTQAQGRLQEAESAWGEARPELDRLAIFEVSREALAHLETLESLRTDLQTHQARVAELETERAQLSVERESSMALTQMRQAELETAQQVWERLEPEIQQARNCRARLGEARKIALQTSEELEAAERSRQAQEVQAGKAKEGLVVAQAEEAEAQRSLEAAPWEALAGILEGLKERGRAQIQSGRRLKAEAEKLDGDAGRLLQARQALEACRHKVEQQASLRGSLKAEADAAWRELEPKLEGAEDAVKARQVLARRREGLEPRLAQLEALRNLLTRRSEGAQELQSRNEAAQAAKAAWEGAEAAAREVQARLEEHEDAADRKARQLELVRWALGLAQERGRLAAGAPCPLCGALEHPALEASDQALKDAQVRQDGEDLARECEVAKAAVAETRSRMEACLGAKAAAREGLEGSQRELLQAASGQEKLEQEISELVARNGFSTVDVELTQASLQAERGLLEDQQRVLDTLEAAWRKADQAWREADSTHLRLEDDARHRADTLMAEEGRIQAARVDLEEEQKNWKEEVSGLGTQLKSFGLDGDPMVGIPEAQRRVEAWTQARTRAQDAELKRSESERLVFQAGVALEAAGETCARFRKALEQRQAVLETLTKESLGILEGQDPEVLAQQQKDSERTLRTAFREADEVRAQIEQAWTRLQGTLESETVAAERLQQRSVEAEARLAADLVALALEGEAALKERHLTISEVQALEACRQRLKSSLDQAKAQVELLVAQAEAHRFQRPQQLELQASVGELAQFAQAAQEMQKQLDLGVAGVRMQLQVQAEARSRHAEKADELHEAQAQLSLWTRMNRLIGTNEGEAFRKFAQVLNLRDLLSHANARLERLRPRYRLVPAKDTEGIERLAFAVEDAAHAGEVRPVGTLSGGETFLVSLSLALALADYRTVRMPVETLLLDEGFGTLDPRTLADVIGVLSSLTSQGTQVGLISHVEALQEKIPAQIRVEPVSPGRSAVRVVGA